MRKLRIGRHWYSWMRDNRLHALVISAYLWGWVRFLPEAKVIRLVQLIRPFDVSLQVFTVMIEVGAIAMLFDQRLCLALLGMFIVFQLMVAALSGILFWQYMVVNALLIWAVWNVPPEVSGPLFGFQNGVTACALLVMLPYRGTVWAPHRLGWWDTPFSCRVHYEVKGASGIWYGLYNDFMCPNERIFGQTYGDFLSDEKRITGHIGETVSREQFDAVNAVGEDLARFEQAKEQLGRNRYDSSLEAVHDRYLTTFCRNFNAGHRKRLFPAWLKAPGGQMFYWGVLPRFRGQEPIDELVIHYREHYFDGRRVVLVTDRIVKEFGVREINP